MAASHNRDAFGLPSKEWLENNPEARGLGLVTGNVNTTARIGSIHTDQPLALLKGKNPPQLKTTTPQQTTHLPPVSDGPLDLTISRQPAAPSSNSHPLSKLRSQPSPLDLEVDEAEKVNGLSTIPTKPPAAYNNQEVTSFRCCFCSLAFSSTEVLLHHIRIHTGDEESKDGTDDDDKMDTYEDKEEKDGESRQQSPCRVSPDTVSGSVTSFTSQATQFVESLPPGAVASPKVLSTPATDDLVGERMEEGESSQSQLPGGNQTSEHYLTTTCEADSTVDIPMHVSKAKQVGPGPSTMHGLQDLSSSNKSTSSHQPMRLEESGATKYQCPICRAGFINHIAQQTHQLSCRPPTEKQFFLQSVCLSENLTCPVCKLKFPSADAKSAHQCHGSDISVQGFNYMYSISDQITSQRHIDAGPENLSSDAFFNASLSNSWNSGGSSENAGHPRSGRSTPESKKGRYCEGCDKSFEFSRNLSRHLQCNPTCRAVMVAKDPGSVKKGGYRFSFMKSKSVAETTRSAAEQSQELRNLSLGTEFIMFGKHSDKTWSSTGYTCKICGKNFKDGLKLGVHTRWEHRKGLIYTKPKGKKWKHHGVRKSGRNSGNKPVSCRACQKTFKLESNLELHLTMKKKCRIQHAKMSAVEEADPVDPTDPDDKRPICKICHRRYWSTWHLKSHMKACHSGQQTVGEKAVTSDGLDSFMCRGFYTVEHVPEAYQHLDSVKGEFVCKFCKQRYRQKKIGYNHVLIHLKINPYKCLLCNYKGRQTACILKHLKHNHQHALQHVSSVNKDAGTSSDTLQDQPGHGEHVLDLSSTSTPVESAEEETISQPLPANIPEDTVENVDFRYSPSKYEVDLCQVVPGGYKCPFCDAIYGSKSRTVCHVRKHTKSRPYKCCYCSFTATYSYMIYQHLRKQHFKNRPVRAPARGRGRGRHVTSLQSHLPPPKLGMKQPQISVGDSVTFPKNAMYYSSFFKALPIDQQYAPIQVPDSDFWKCKVCEKTSTDLSVMRTHALTHTQLKPFHCLLCPHKASRLGMVISHLQDEHKAELEAHFGSNAQFDELNEEAHAMETVHANDIQDLHMINEDSTEASATNQTVPSLKKKLIPSSPTIESRRRRSSRGRQIKPQKSLQDDYIYDFTESESDTSQHRNSPVVHNFIDSETLPKPVNLHKTISPQLIKSASQAGEIPDVPSSKEISTPSESPAKKDGAANLSPLKLNVVVLPGCRERIFLCPHCNFKSNYDSVIQAHLSLKHNRGQSLSEFNLNQEVAAKTTSDDRMDVGPQKSVLGWFPHQWKGGGAAADRDHNVGDGNIQATFKLQDSGSTGADDDTNKEMMDTVNTLYSYKAGPAEQSANFDNEPHGGFNCGYCQERPQGKAAAIAHLQSHTGEQPYCCDLCDVTECNRVKILSHIQESHRMQVLDIIEKKRQLSETSLSKETSTDASADWTDLEDANSADGDVTSADDTDMNENSPGTVDAEIQLSKAIPVTQMLGSGFHTKAIRKKNLSFYKQIIFIRGPKEEKLHIEQDKITGRHICPYCKKTFSGRNATKQHSRIHTHEKPYYCKLCYHNARNIASIMKHLQAQHKHECKGSRGGVVKGGRGGVPKDGNVKTKQKQDAKGTGSQIVNDGKEQDEDEKDEGKKMGETKEEEAEREEEAKHLDIPVAEIRRPESPSQMLQEFFDFQAGEIEKNLQLQTLPDGRCKCPFCARIQVNMYNTKRHIRIHTEERPYACNLCDYRGIQYTAIRTHLLRKHANEEKIAAYCSQKGPIHDEDENEAEFIDEDIEELPVPMTDKIQRVDVKKMEALRMKQGISDVSPGKRQWNARWTNYYVYKPGPVEQKYRDTRRHVPSSCYRCPFCEKDDIHEKGKFLSHIRVVHSGEKPYRCKLCGYSAGQQSTIVHHVSNYHKDDTQQEDSKKIDRLVTPTKTRLEKGPNTRQVSSDASAEPSTMFQQENTPETSPEKSNAKNQGDAKSPKEKQWEYIPGEIEKNLQVEKNIATNDYTCSHCGRTGLQNIRTLKSHLRTHTNEMPFKCKRCDYICRQQSSMRYHVTKIHKMSPSLASPVIRNLEDLTIDRTEVAPRDVARRDRDMTSSPVGAVDDGKTCDEVDVKGEETKDFGLYTFTRGKMEKRVQQQIGQLQRDVVTGSYLCSYCMQGFGSKYSYVVHVRTHTGEKPYACKVCDYRAANRNSMTWHIKTQHTPTKRVQSPIVRGHKPTQNGDKEGGSSLLLEAPRKHIPQERDSHEISISNQAKDPEIAHTCKMHEDNASTKSPLKDVSMRNHTGNDDVVEMADSLKVTEAFADRRLESNAGESSQSLHQNTSLQDQSRMEQLSSPTSQTSTQQPECIYMHKLDTQVVENYLAENEDLSRDIARLFYTFSVGMVERNLNIEMDKSSNQYICPFCQGLFPTLEAVRKHGRLHTGEKPYHCNLCTRQECKESKMVQHIVARHKSALRKAARKGTSILDRPEKEDEDTEDESNVHQVWGCIAPHVTYTVDVNKQVCYVCDLCGHKIAGYPQIVTHLTRYHKVNIPNPERAIKEDQAIVAASYDDQETEDMDVSIGNQVSPTIASRPVGSQKSPSSAHAVHQVSPASTSMPILSPVKPFTFVSKLSPAKDLTVNISPSGTSAFTATQASPRHMQALAVSADQLSPRNKSTLADNQGSPRNPSTDVISQVSPRSVPTSAASQAYPGDLSTPAVTQPKKLMQHVEKTPPAVNTSLFSVDEKQKLVVINSQDKATKQSFVCNKCGHLTLRQEDMMTHITETHPEAVLYVNPMNPQERTASATPSELQNTQGLDAPKPSDGEESSDNLVIDEDVHEGGNILKDVQPESIKSIDIKNVAQETDSPMPHYVVTETPISCVHDQTVAGENVDEKSNDKIEMPKTLTLKDDIHQTLGHSTQDVFGTQRSNGLMQGVENAKEGNKEMPEDSVLNSEHTTSGIRRSTRILKDDKSNKGNQGIPETLASKDVAPSTPVKPKIAGRRRLDQIINQLAGNTDGYTTQVHEGSAAETDESNKQSPSASGENAAAMRSDRNLNKGNKLDVDSDTNKTEAGNYEDAVAAAKAVTVESTHEAEMEQLSPRSAVEHNYARSKLIVEGDKEVSSESTLSIALQETPAAVSMGASPKRRGRRRSTRRSITEGGEGHTMMAVTPSRENLASVAEKDLTAGSSNPATSLQLPLPPGDDDVIVRRKSRELESNASSDIPASECSSIADKIKDEKVDETSISDYFVVTIGNTEKTLGRNFQRDKTTGFYICPYCDKSSRLLQTTKIHMRLHTGEKPYQCKLCDVKTVQHCSIISHIKNHHPDVLGIKPKEPRKTKKRSRQGTSNKETAVVPLKLANRVKKLGSTSPMKTNYKKISKKLKTAEEDESFVDMQRSQQIYEEAKQMESMTGLLKKKTSPDAGNVVISEGIGISGLKRFAQTPIPKLGVANLTQQFLQVALEKQDQIVDQHKIVSSSAGQVDASTTVAVSDAVSSNVALDLSVNIMETAAPGQALEVDNLCIQSTSSAQISSPVQMKHPDRKKALKRKKIRRRKKGKKLKRSKLSDNDDDGRMETEPAEIVKSKGSRYSKDSFLDKYYTIEIGPIEKTLKFESDPVTKRIKCPYCSMTLCHVWSTYNHVRLHTGERPFSCNLCTYKAVQLTSVKTHLYKSHNDVISAEIQSMNSTGEMNTGLAGRSTGPKRKLPSVLSKPKTIATVPRAREVISNADVPSTSTTADDISGGQIASGSNDVPTALFNVYNCFSFVEPVEVTHQDYKKDPVTGFMICPHCDATVAKRTLVEHICGHTGDLPYRCKACEHKTAKRSAMIRHIQLYHREDAFSRYVPHQVDGASASSTHMDEDKQSQAEKLPESTSKKIKRKNRLRVRLNYKKPGKKAASKSADEEQEADEGTPKVVDEEKASRSNVEGDEKKTDKRTTKVEDQEMAAISKVVGEETKADNGIASRVVDEEKDADNGIASRVVDEEKDADNGIASRDLDEEKDADNGIASRVVDEEKEADTGIASRVVDEEKEADTGIASRVVDEEKEADDKGTSKVVVEEKTVRSKIVSEETKVERGITTRVVDEENKERREVSSVVDEEKNDIKESGLDKDETSKGLEGRNKDEGSPESGKVTPEQNKLCQFYSLKVSKIEKELVIAKVGRSYACPFCPSTFVRSADAKRHSRVHTGDNPYKCNLCSKETRQQNSILKHIEKMHAAEVASITEKEGNSRSEDLNVGEETLSVDHTTRTTQEKMRIDDDGKVGDESASHEVSVTNPRQPEEQNTSVDGNADENASRPETVQLANECSDGDLDAAEETTGVNKTRTVVHLESEGNMPNLTDIDTQDIDQMVEKSNEMMEESKEQEKQLNVADDVTVKDGSLQTEKAFSENEMYSSDDQSGPAFIEGTVSDGRKPIEDILEQLWTDVDEDDQTGDEECPQVGSDQMCDEEGGGGNHSEVKDKPELRLDNQVKDVDNQGNNDKHYEEEKMDIDGLVEGGKSDDDKDKGDAEDDRQETSSTSDDKVCLVEVPDVDEYEFEDDEPFIKKRPKQTSRHTPVKLMNKKTKTSSPGSSTSYHGNQSTPLSPSASSTKGSPRGKPLHYTYEPKDEDTFNVVMESNICMFECPHCPYRHRMKSVVRTHIRTHTKHKPYHCRYCDFASTHGTVMKRHLWSKHSIGPDPVKSDADSSHESSHYKFNASDEEKNLVLKRDNDGFICSYCDRRFTTEGNLRIHIRTHTGDKPYQCRYCEFRTAYGFVMQKHINMTHKEQPSDPNDADKPIMGIDFTFNPSEEETSRVLCRCPGSDIYKCEVCGRESVHEYDAVAHLRSHTGDTPYYCAHCDTHTMTQIQIIKHVNNMHKPMPKKM